MDLAAAGVKNILWQEKSPSARAFRKGSPLGVDGATGATIFRFRFKVRFWFTVKVEVQVHVQVQV